MTHYRIYGLNETGGIVRGADYMLDRDEDAAAVAADLLDTFPGTEVWSGKRRLACLQRTAPERRRAG
jgi:hypothetical protein